ncbi:MAG TPA: phage holin family protein [Humibacter sp.]|nr:phage holin family protein [Humibacter sp.]
MIDPETPAERKAESTSLGDLLGEVSRDISTLMRQEVELAKAELRESAARAGKGAGMLGGAGYAGMMTVLFLSIAAWWGLGYLIGNAWSGLIIAVIWAIIGLILFVVGRSAVKSVKGAPQTVESLKEIPDTLKRNGENR